MAADVWDLNELIGAFADPEARGAAAVRLARHLEVDEVVIFTPDPELGVFLPAPGLRQTLPGAAEWRAAVERCARDGAWAGPIPGAGGGRMQARGIAAGAGVVVLVAGDGAVTADLSALRPVLPVLGALFRAEREVDAIRVRARAADEAAERARVLMDTLQRMRSRLEAALAEAQAARADANARAEEAEQLAEEMQAQALEMEQQSAELELLNEALAARTDEAERASEAADAANRTKSDFLANMSHELRTPINAVLGYTQLLEMEIPGPVTAAQRVHLERIISSSRHLLRLVNDILDVAKVEAGQLVVQQERETVGTVVAEALALVQAQALERGVVLRDRCARPDTQYVGDGDRVRQILLNLLSNAVKFTEPGGTVTVRCASASEPHPEAVLAGPPPWTLLQVEDTGVGIAPEAAESVFKPFVQVQPGRMRTQGGTGLGLTISRQLARLMGGDLTLRSEAGKGSCFSLWLPTHAGLGGSPDDTLRVRS